MRQKFLAYFVTLLLSALLALPLLGYFPPHLNDRPMFNGDISMMQLDLQTVGLSSIIEGKKSFIFYFLPSCPHCQEAAPTVSRLFDKYGASIQFIAIASSRSRLSDVREFKEQFKFNFQVVQDSGTFGQKHDLRSYPAFMLTDGSNTPVEMYNAYSNEMEILLEVAITRYIGKNALALLNPAVYYGSLVCSACHAEVYRSWSLNHHAVALNSLITTQKDADPKCIGCHVVGYGQKGGYVDLERTPGLANVGCESCHGHAGGHNKVISAQEQAALSRKTPEERYGALCISCHDAEHTISFDLKKGIPMAGHHQDRTISHVDWLTRRSLLMQDEASRPLLAFPPGKIQGAKSCEGCHAKAYAGWKAGPHASAMTSLQIKRKEQDVSCVKCHATLKDASQPEKLESYAAGIEIGIECESCHGPGEAHIKAGGGRGNIVALTKSCPVCVIDSICTSCHTSSQDPNFNLDAALEKVRSAHR